jgi:pyruvate/2-oxoglutarate dehydrogenase complex dihydrolipoamide acyltransferase (E2) component
MEEKQVEHLVAEVLKRMLPELGATGAAGTVIAVFSGATVGFNEAVQQVRSLVLRGYRVQLAFSRGAELLYARLVWQQLEGFPHVSPVDESKWLRILKEARAVVVPLLSVNTLSKLSFLLADNLASNLMLHGLFTGKPVILAQNGVDPVDPGRAELEFHKGSPALALAIQERLQVARSYGCQITDVAEVCAAVEASIAPERAAPRPSQRIAAAPASAASARRDNIVTAADVLQAHHEGRNLQMHTSARMTPLARELASKHGVSLLQDVSY